MNIGHIYIDPGKSITTYDWWHALRHSSLPSFVVHQWGHFPACQASAFKIHRVAIVVPLKSGPSTFGEQNHQPKRSTGNQDLSIRRPSLDPSQILEAVLAKSVMIDDTNYGMEKCNSLWRFSGAKEEFVGYYFYFNQDDYGKTLTFS